MIKKLKSLLKFVVKTIDKQKCEDIEAPPFVCGSSHFSHGYSPYGRVKSNSYLGVPAPVVAPYDPWFGDAPKTEKAMEYVLKKNEDLYRRLAEPKLKEPENIHQKMYERASKYWGTWKEELPGGSENFQEGTNGWNSGTGIRQFQ